MLKKNSDFLFFQLCIDQQDNPADEQINCFSPDDLHIASY